MFQYKLYAIKKILKFLSLGHFDPCPHL